MTKIPLFVLILIISLQLLSCSDDNPATTFPDYLAPTIIWRAPAADSVLVGTVELNFSVTDDEAVTSVEIYRNGSSPDGWQLPFQDDPFYTLDWDTRAVEDGIHTLEIRAKDENGNLGISPALQVIVANNGDPTDQSPPEITWVYPAGSAKMAGEITLAFSIHDESSVTAVDVYRSGYLLDEWRFEGHADTLYTINWDTRQVTDGVYSIEIRALDSNGNLGRSPVLQLEVTNDADDTDLQPPDVWWTAPYGGATLSDSATLSLSWFDEVGVDSVSLYLNGTRVINYPTTGREGSQSFTWNTLRADDGVHLWQARAWDAVGNTGSSLSLMLLVQNEQPPSEDRTPPVINWLSPTPGDTLEGETLLRFQALDETEVDSVFLWINGILHHSAAVDSGTHLHEVAVTLDFPDGTLYISAGVVDASSNRSLTPSLGFYLWNDRPEVIWVPDDYETIQEAINASEDGDTVRVGAGTYYEGQINIWDLRITLESEQGPKETIIDASDWYNGIILTGHQDTSQVIRGFTIRNAPRSGIWVSEYSGVKLVNCIIKGCTRSSLWIETNRNVLIRNNVFVENGSPANIEIHTSYGVFENNLVVHSGGYAFWNLSIFENPIRPDYNLIWQYENLTDDAPGIRFGPHNLIDVDPLIENEFYHLSANSPCINAGNPALRDLDGSVSDIGAYGGPYAY
ncbi:Ig-like domain-containing protein [Calditrichota bacterium]